MKLSRNSWHFKLYEIDNPYYNGDNDINFCSYFCSIFKILFSFLCGFVWILGFLYICVVIFPIVGCTLSLGVLIWWISMRNKSTPPGFIRKKYYHIKKKFCPIIEWEG